MIYQLMNNPFGNPSGVKKKAENGEVFYIPNDPANTDYQAYLAWLNEGNVPEPAEEQQ